MVVNMLNDVLLQRSYGILESVKKGKQLEQTVEQKTVFLPELRGSCVDVTMPRQSS